jgi:hypothetical protein
VIFLDDVWTGTESSSGLLVNVLGKPSGLTVRLLGTRMDGGRGGMAGLGDSA